MMKEKAKELLKTFKVDNYASGLDVLDQAGKHAARYGKSCLIASSSFPWKTPIMDKIRASLSASGVAIEKEIAEAGANTPREDVYAIQKEFESSTADMILVVGGGSAIDGVKAANVLATYRSDDLDAYLGTGKVTAAREKTGKKVSPVVAIQLAASSASHLTKYSNITDMATKQKKLIIDEEIIPPSAIFDYSVTASMGKDFTLDGAFDGIAHCLEVYYGASSEKMELIEKIALTGIELIVENMMNAVKDPKDLSAREALGLGTDLGGHAIMVGGTNGGHLTSFSLVDILSHGRACAITNPYYTVFFAPAIQRQLREIAGIYSRMGYLKADVASLSGYDLGKAVAEAMFNLSDAVGFPKTLGEISGFSDAHIAKALKAAKDPALEMKLKNMPVSLTASEIDNKMSPILEMAKTGDLAAFTPVS